MGFKPSCCFGFGFISFLGVIFYAISAFMVHNRNWVFLEHKNGMDKFTSTDADYKEKLMQMLTVCGVRITSHTNLQFCYR